MLTQASFIQGGSLMLPFQGEREEMVWFGGFRGEKLYHRAKSPQCSGEMGLLGGVKKGSFLGYPLKTPFGREP